MQIKKLCILISLIISILLVNGLAVQAAGKLVIDSLYGTSLEGNMLGDPVTRDMVIYLPPDYESSEKEYAVIYLLHTGGGNELFYPYNEFPPLLQATELFTLPQDFPQHGFAGWIDSLITEDLIEPLIIVMPNINSAYGGSFCINSALNGNYEDYIIEDIVPYIDTNYRTLANSSSRAIAGHCMGGYGATYLAMKHPDVFGALAGHSTELCIDALARACQPYIAMENPDGITGPDPLNPAKTFTNFMYMFSAAYSPNPANPPYYVDLPLDEDCNLREDVLLQWANYDPIQMFPDHIAALQSLKGIYFDVGNADELQSSYFLTPFVDALNAAGIVNSFELYEGEHFSRLYSRLDSSLKYLSAVLEHDPAGPTNIQEGNVKGIWTSAGSPYLIEGEITVPDGETLLIEPGSEIIFQGHYKFNVEGTLVAKGTAEDSIKFTAGDHSLGWHGIRFNNTNAANDSSLFEYCQFEYGKANSGEGLSNRSGGAMAILSTDKVRVSCCLFQNNMCYHDNMEVSAGGAMVVTGSALIEFNEFRNNTGRYGGAMTIYYPGTNPLVRNNYIHHNSGHGTLNIGASAEPILINNIIVYNVTDSHGHLHFANAGGVAVFLNNTIAYNTSANVSGAIFINHGICPLFINNIIYGNTPAQVRLETKSGLDFINCLIEGGQENFSGKEFTGTYQDNIDGDPFFVNAGDNDFRLRDCSPCIGMGIQSLDFDGTTYTSTAGDFSCNQRPCPASTPPDIGAIEHALGTPLATENMYQADQPSPDGSLSCYPNPAMESTKIMYEMKNAGIVRIIIYDLKGNVVSAFPERYQSAGKYEVIWDMRDRIPGIYCCQLCLSGRMETLKLVKL